MLRVFLLALKALFTERERKEITTHFHSKALEDRASFSTKNGLFFAPKKREKIKFSRVKHLCAFQEEQHNDESAEQRERESLLGYSFSRRARF